MTSVGPAALARQLPVPMLEVAALCGHEAAWYALARHARRRLATLEETAWVFEVQPRHVEAWSDCPTTGARGAPRYDLVQVLSWRWRAGALRTRAQALRKLVRAIQHWDPPTARLALVAAFQAVCAAWQERFPYDRRPSELMAAFASRRQVETVLRRCRSHSKRLSMTMIAASQVGEIVLAEAITPDLNLATPLTECGYALGDLVSRRRSGLLLQEAILGTVLPWVLQGTRPAPLRPPCTEQAERSECPICRGLPAETEWTWSLPESLEVIDNLEVVSFTDDGRLERCPVCRTSYEYGHFHDDEDSPATPPTDAHWLTRLSD